mmetsp:Transcript_28538/g.37342  ORF Transcript_28538/g.37342 Transcript_28538/m.37342 type:complete len:91 (+) Transcript_28538:218-490(+)
MNYSIYKFYWPLGFFYAHKSNNSVNYYKTGFSCTREENQVKAIVPIRINQSKKTLVLQVALQKSMLHWLEKHESPLGLFLCKIGPIHLQP